MTLYRGNQVTIPPGGVVGANSDQTPVPVPALWIWVAAVIVDAVEPNLHVAAQARGYGGQRAADGAGAEDALGGEPADEDGAARHHAHLVVWECREVGEHLENVKLVEEAEPGAAALKGR